MRTAIFDLDGTLADTGADLIAAANTCFRMPLLHPVADKATAFRGGRAMLRLGLERSGAPWDEAEVDRHFPNFLRSYSEKINVHTRLYDGVEAALDRLAAEGWVLGICTNKPEALAEDLLARLGLRHRFAAMLGADTLAVRKPDAEHLLETIRRAGGNLARSVLIGDTVTDRSAARNANVPCVLVAFGPEGEAVRALEPEAMLPHYDNLSEVLNKLIA